MPSNPHVSAYWVLPCISQTHRWDPKSISQRDPKWVTFGFPMRISCGSLLCFFLRCFSFCFSLPAQCARSFLHFLVFLCLFPLRRALQQPLSECLAQVILNFPANGIHTCASHFSCKVPVPSYACAFNFVMHSPHVGGCSATRSNCYTP